VKTHSFSSQNNLKLSKNIVFLNVPQIPSVQLVRFHFVKQMYNYNHIFTKSGLRDDLLFLFSQFQCLITVPSRLLSFHGG